MTVFARRRRSTGGGSGASVHSFTHATASQQFPTADATNVTWDAVADPAPSGTNPATVAADAFTIVDADSYDVSVNVTASGGAAITWFYVYVILNDDSAGPFYRFQASGLVPAGGQVPFSINVSSVPLQAGDTLKLNVQCDQSDAVGDFVMIVSR